MSLGFTESAISVSGLGPKCIRNRCEIVFCIWNCIQNISKSVNWVKICILSWLFRFISGSNGSNTWGRNHKCTNSVISDLFHQHLCTIMQPNVSIGNQSFYRILQKNDVWKLQSCAKMDQIAPQHLSKKIEFTRFIVIELPQILFQIEYGRKSGSLQTFQTFSRNQLPS